MSLSNITDIIAWRHGLTMQLREKKTVQKQTNLLMVLIMKTIMYCIQTRIKLLKIVNY